MLDHILYFIIAHGLLGLGMVHLEPTSYLRILFVILIAFCCFQATKSDVIQAIPGSIGLVYTVGFILHSANFLCLAKLKAPEDHRYRWAWNQLFNPRDGLRSLPANEAMQSRGQFLMHRCFDATWLTTIILFTKNYRLNIYSSDLTDYPDGFIFRLSSMDAREIVIRLYLYSVAMLMPYCTLRLLHCLGSILWVACGDDPSNWPPLFGKWKDVYTIRNYYG
jgi:hypothetical protein